MNLENDINKIIELSEKFNVPLAVQYCNAVLSSLQSKKFHLAILGEFKRGKSTLVNSIIGRQLLPYDVLPATATINVLEYAETESCIITWMDGKTENLELTTKSLSRLSVDGDLDASKIKHVLINISLPLLKEDIVIIDTPGVNDISKSRREVTDQILPYCDAAIFLLDAVAPVTRTEAEFLETKILSQKIESIIFVLSKIDRLEDEDEMEEAMEGAKNRLRDVLKSEPILIPYSSFSILEYKDDRYLLSLLEQINIIKQKSFLEKEDRAKARLKLAINLLSEEIQNLEGLFKTNTEKLKDYQEHITNIKESVESKFQQLIASIEKVGRETLLKIFDTSMKKLHDNLESDIGSQIRLNEANVDRFWERVMPVQVERTLRQYSENKGLEIHNFLNNFSHHVSREYQSKFESPLKIEMQQFGIEMPKFSANYSESSSSNVDQVVQNALPISLGMIVGSMFMPGIGTIIGSLGGQIIGANMKSKKNEDMKQLFMLELPSVISSICNSYQKNVELNINSWFDQLISSVENYHKTQEFNLKKRIENILQPPAIEDKIDSQKLNIFKSELENLQKKYFKEVSNV